jgi:hypothetical protein
MMMQKVTMIISSINGIDSDPFSEAVYNGLAVRIGSEIPELDYAKDVAGVSFDAHIIVNFYQHFK